MAGSVFTASMVPHAHVIFRIQAHEVVEEPNALYRHVDRRRRLASLKQNARPCRSSSAPISNCSSVHPLAERPMRVDRVRGEDIRTAQKILAAACGCLEGANRIRPRMRVESLREQRQILGESSKDEKSSADR